VRQFLLFILSDDAAVHVSLLNGTPFGSDFRQSARTKITVLIHKEPLYDVRTSCFKSPIHPGVVAPSQPQRGTAPCDTFTAQLYRMVAPPVRSPAKRQYPKEGLQETTLLW